MVIFFRNVTGTRFPCPKSVPVTSMYCILHRALHRGQQCARHHVKNATSGSPEHPWIYLHGHVEIGFPSSVMRNSFFKIKKHVQILRHSCGGRINFWKAVTVYVPNERALVHKLPRTLGTKEHITFTTGLPALPCWPQFHKP